MRIDLDEGAWVGTWQAYTDNRHGEEWYVVEGEGAYEGLTAVYRYRTDDNSFEGVIMPGELPAQPDPLAPPAEETEPSPSAAAA